MPSMVNPFNGGSHTREPLSIEPGETGSISFNHPNDPDPGGLRIVNGDNVYIRIAGSGESATASIDFSNPRISVRAGSTGRIADLSLSSPSGALCYTGACIGSMIGTATLSATHYPNVWRIVVPDIANYNHIDEWELRIENNTGEMLKIVWVLADSESEAGQPWMHISSPLVLDTLLTGETHTAPFYLSIANRGTGDLTIEAPLSSGAFDLAIPETIYANSFGQVAVQVNATSTKSGTYKATVNFESNDALALSDPDTGHNRRAELSFTRMLAAPTLRIVTE